MAVASTQVNLIIKAQQARSYIGSRAGEISAHENNLDRESRSNAANF